MWEQLLHTEQRDRPWFRPRRPHQAWLPVRHAALAQLDSGCHSATDGLELWGKPEIAVITVQSNTPHSTTPYLEKKHHEHYRLSLEERISNFNNFWYQYFWNNWPSNDHSIFHLNQCLILHFLGKTKPTKYELQWTEIRQKSSPTLSLVIVRKIARF